jgi:hypothetical protein
MTHSARINALADPGTRLQNTRFSLTNLSALIDYSTVGVCSSYRRRSPLLESGRHDVLMQGQRTYTDDTCARQNQTPSVARPEAQVPQNLSVNSQGSLNVHPVSTRSSEREMPAPRSSSRGERQVHGQGGKQQQLRGKRRTCHHDFAEYEQYSESLSEGISAYLSDPRPCLVPLSELPVLTRQGVSCSLRHYTDRIQQQSTEPYGGTSTSCSQSQGNGTDLPPPYVERIEDDSVAMKVSPVPSDTERATVKENQNGVYKVTGSRTIVTLTHSSHSSHEHRQEPAATCLDAALDNGKISIWGLDP